MAERITFDKPYDLKGEVNDRMVLNVDEMFGQLYWTMAQLENKLSNNEGLLSSLNTSINQESDAAAAINVTRWLRGPWTLDDPAATNKNVAMLSVDLTAGVTLNDYSPSGIDDAVGLSFIFSGGVVDTNLTGLKAPPSTEQKRLFLLRNNDADSSIILKHEDSSSQEVNRFRLPGSSDVTMAAGQNIWLYYDPHRRRWTSTITSHASGGLSGGASSSAELNATQAQLESMNTTPVQIISAPGANKIIVPVMMLVTLIVTSGYGSSPTFTLVYDGSTTALTSAANPAWGTTGTKFSSAISVSTNFSTAGGGFNPSNKSVKVRLSADPLAGGAATAVITAVYFTADTA